MTIMIHNNLITNQKVTANVKANANAKNVTKRNIPISIVPIIIGSVILVETAKNAVISPPNPVYYPH